MSNCLLCRNRERNALSEYQRKKVGFRPTFKVTHPLVITFPTNASDPYLDLIRRDIPMPDAAMLTFEADACAAWFKGGEPLRNCVLHRPLAWPLTELAEGRHHY